MNISRYFAKIGSILLIHLTAINSVLYAQPVEVRPIEKIVKGELLLPPGDGSRGIHLIIDVVNNESLNRHWLSLEEGFKFQKNFVGTLEKLEVATALSTIVYQLNEKELSQLASKSIVNLGTIDLRTQLKNHKITILSQNKNTLRIGMWLNKPVTDTSGYLPSLGSRQFPEIEAGTEINYLIPSKFDTAYFLLEEPSDNKRGKEWRSGKQKLFGPFSSSKLPSVLEIQ